MKRNLNIFALALLFLITQACGSKSENKSEESVPLETSAVEEGVTPTVAEKRAEIEKKRMEREEMRRIKFEELAKISPTYTDAKGKVVYNKAEVAPSFTGGNKAMMAYISDNVQFPKEAKENGVEGTVFVDFIIDEKGNVREVEVIEATSEEAIQSFREEAIRVVSSMPKWIPGRQRGKPVDVKFTLPITFQIS